MTNFNCPKNCGSVTSKYTSLNVTPLQIAVPYNGNKMSCSENRCTRKDCDVCFKLCIISSMFCATQK